MHNIQIEDCEKGAWKLINFVKTELKNGRHKRGRNLWNLSREYSDVAALEYAKGNHEPCKESLQLSVSYFDQLLDLTASEPDTVDCDYISYQWQWALLNAILVSSESELRRLIGKQLDLAQTHFNKRDPLGSDFEMYLFKALCALALKDKIEASRMSEHAHSSRWPGWEHRVNLLQTIALNKQSAFPEAWNTAWLEWIDEMKDDDFYLPEAALWFFGLAALQLNFRLNGISWEPAEIDERIPTRLFP
ncbi:MAG: hypothetical protein NXH78_11150 [Hyphomonadaceae bacterium]|nr:hypothetical protein [Hyphomonadaceae bacterium]